MMNNESPAAQAALRLYAQSYAKSVGDVETLFAPNTLTNGLLHPDREDISADLSALDAIQRSQGSEPVTSFSARRRVLAATYEATRVRRVTATDRYVAHRAYPSPRGLFGVDALIKVGAEDDPTVYRLNPQGGMLHRQSQGRTTEPTAQDWAVATILVTTHPDRYPAPYGSLRASLAYLEGGHLAATLALTLTRAGLRIRTELGEPSAGGPGSPPPDAPDTRVAATLTVLDSDAAAPVVSTAAVRGLDSLSSSGSSLLRDWFDRRSSGVPDTGLGGSDHVDPADARRVTAAMIAAAQTIDHLLPHAGALRIYQHWLGDRPSRHTTVELTGEGPPTDRDTDPNARMHASMGYTMTADLTAFSMRYGSTAGSVVHSVLGWIAQWGCLAAASDGLSARPGRNFDEGAWAAELESPLPHTACYQLWLQHLPPDTAQHLPWSSAGILV